MGVSSFNNVEMGKRIKELRKKKGFDQKAVSGAMGIKRETLSTIESGTRALKDQELVRIAEILDTSCDYLLTGISAENKDLCGSTGLSEEAIAALKRLENGDMLGYPDWIGGNHLLMLDKDLIVGLINWLLTNEEGLALLQDIALYTFTDFENAKILLPEDTPTVEVVHGKDGNRGIKTEIKDGEKVIPTSRVARVSIGKMQFESAINNHTIRMRGLDIAEGALLRVSNSIRYVRRRIKDEQASKR